MSTAFISDCINCEVSVVWLSMGITGRIPRFFLDGVIPRGDNEEVYGKFFDVKYEGTLFAAKKVHPWDSVQDNREARDLYLEKCRTWYYYASSPKHRSLFSALSELVDHSYISGRRGTACIYSYLF